MMKTKTITILIIFILSFLISNSQSSKTVRFATFNTSLYRNSLGEIEKDLKSGENEQMKIIAEIIQRNDPDILALQEFDFAEDNAYVKLYQKHYLNISQNGANPVKYPYFYAFPSNTGILTEFDLNKDGKFKTANDAYGYGRYPGQYAFAILSKYPIDETGIRTFQYFLWKDMPDANIPLNSDHKTYYEKEELKIFRLSSKNHVDVPVIINKDTIHVLIAHPTPPVFDGKEDRNGKRNHDEIRLFADYISGGERASYLYDDKGKYGGLGEDTKFVILGDMNADPIDGDSYENAILQLTDHPLINSKAASGKHVPESKGSAVKHNQRPDKGDPYHNTSVFGLRIDYVLPSANLKVKSSGVFWPSENEGFFYLVKDKKGSDHRLVWVDIKI
jgi:endonuclease/exonuclease/phosphatase family metal-dependent hydrolase